MSGLGAVLIGVVVGLAIVFGVLWKEREVVRRAARQRRGELFGEDESLEADPVSSVRSSGRGGDLKRRRLTIGVCLLAAAGSAVVAVQTSDEVVRVVNIVGCAIFVVGSGVLLFRPR